MIDVSPYPKEPRLFRIALVVALLAWLLIIVGTLGVALLYLLLGFLVYVLAHSAFIAYLKGNAVEITAQQYPLLHRHYLACCERLGMARVPRLYLLQSEGMMNALATRFLNTNYVVLYSGIIDALEAHPESLRFYMGHELCHIARGHLKWSLLLWPAKVLPVLGPAYARAQESSCDCYGLACCASPRDAMRAMAVIASGPGQWSRLNVRAFRDQAEESGRFWMSFHELTGGYPWLCKRVGRVAAWADGSTEDFPRRHPLAWILSIFVPNLGFGHGGGPLGILLIVAILGIVAAVAIPAYQDYTIKAQVQQSIETADTVAGAIAGYVDTNRTLPTSLQDVGMPADFSEGLIAKLTLGEDGRFSVVYGGPPKLRGTTIEFVPYLNEAKEIEWDCLVGTLAVRYRPPRCRAPSASPP